MNLTKVIVLLPALNEEKAIGGVIDQIPVGLLNNLGFNIEIIVADGMSTDHTAEIARGKKATVLRSSRGKGYQVRSTLLYLCNIRNNWPDYLVMLDSDGTYPPKYIIPMIAMLKNDLCVVVAGYRVSSSGSMSRIHNVGNKILTLLANILYSTKIKDLCTGYWAFNKKTLETINLTANGFDLEANIFSEINHAQFRLGQIPINYLPRIGNGHLRIKHGFQIAKKLIVEWL